MAVPPSFASKKSRILRSLSVPVEQYDDLSPKGSIDIGIRDLIDEINALEGCVTTSSCAGRISVFLEGKRSAASEDVAERDTTAGVGGKGGGGRWLFVSHDPVDTETFQGCWFERLGMKSQHLEESMKSGTCEEKRFIHFKFEPMILHILTASLRQAQIVLSAALQAGFRESGALNLTSPSSEPATPMVGVRSMGLALESVIGYEHEGVELCIVPEWQLKNLVQISNQRFVENTKRIGRFKSLLKEMSGNKEEVKMGDHGEWEDREARRERKRAEGLKRKEEMRAASAAADVPTEEGLEQNL